jgi:hypothetical protein
MSSPAQLEYGHALVTYVEGPPLTPADIANNPPALVADLATERTVPESVQAARLAVRQEVQTHFREFYRRGPAGDEYRRNKATVERFIDTLGQPVIPLMPIYTDEGAIINSRGRPKPSDKPSEGIVSKILGTAESWAQDERSKGFQDPNADLAFSFIQRNRPFWTTASAAVHELWHGAQPLQAQYRQHQDNPDKATIRFRPALGQWANEAHAAFVQAGYKGAVNAEQGIRDIPSDYYGLGIPEKHLHSMLESPSRYIGHTVCLELLIGKDPELLPAIMDINQNPTEGLPEYRARINALYPGLYDRLTTLDVRDHSQGVAAARNVINLLYGGNMYAPVQNDGTDMLKDYFSTALARTHAA